ncbi:MAG: hybrid sensor histidine kinase/response regulator [Bacteroidetes bacterium]|nr:MAG: hybrid sensor histidine kinase/response regulator [Bacteroidota bacterium]
MKNNNLLDGKYKFSDIVDISQLTEIFTKFSKATGFTIGLVDNNSLEILVKTGWHDICVNFHRIDVKACEVCKNSNKILFTNLEKEKAVKIVECEHGLYDCATPIIIEGKHIANLATGQLLMQKPDISRFKQQAKEFDFDEQAYIKALLEVPVVNKEKVTEMMDYLAEFSIYIAKQGLNKLRTNKLNDELIKAKENAEESDKLKTEFIHNMSHEIRTPMNGILGFSNFLNNPELSNEERKNYINIVQSSGNQLLRIIDDILEISKLGTKQVKTIEKEICLNDLLLEHFTVFDIKAKENKIPLYLNKGLSDKESIILTDETKLNKILSNLLENALKFTKDGFIEFGYTLKTESEPVELEIYVKDTGIGIKQESQKTIFDRFSQEEKELSRNVGGLGLGLSIAKENAELLGGKITLKSEKGNGAIFYVTIPYKPVNHKHKNDNSNTDKTRTTKKQAKYTILIVEDEEVNYLYLDILLTDIKLNLAILHAKHGKEAVKMCKENSAINLILMDIKMPIMTGLEATRLIKEFRPDLPIIAQTAYSTNDEKKQAFSAGCNDFISKPISEETLNNVINKYLIM